jgi:hypothetical protein
LFREELGNVGKDGIDFLEIASMRIDDVVRHQTFSFHAADSGSRSGRFGPFGQFPSTVGKRVYARMLGSDGLTS